MSYGQELCLEIGAKKTYSSAQLKGELKGEWQLGTRASDWSIFSIDDIENPLAYLSDDVLRLNEPIENFNGQIFKGILYNRESDEYEFNFNQ